jgi:predicted aldo/keto reductase-like oxidoreductase
MMSYNYRLMHTDQMRRAVDACVAAGIGLTAMKTQGGGSIRSSVQSEHEMVSRFLRQGYTDAQAKLKAVWHNPSIASICSEMPNLTLLKANVAAALDRISLSTQDRQLLNRHAEATRSDYCAGCVHICESTLDDPAPIGEVMRALMYWRSYGDRERAVRCYRAISPAGRRQLSRCDYTQAEKQCPQQMAIGRLVRTAFEEFNTSRGS